MKFHYSSPIIPSIVILLGTDYNLGTPMISTHSNYNCDMENCRSSPSRLIAPTGIVMTDIWKCTCQSEWKTYDSIRFGFWFWCITIDKEHVRACHIYILTFLFWKDELMDIITWVAPVLFCTTIDNGVILENKIPNSETEVIHIYTYKTNIKVLSVMYLIKVSRGAYTSIQLQT